MLHPIRIRMTFGWIRTGGAPEKCRNCFTRDEMGKRSPAASCSLVKYTTLPSSSTVGSVEPSGNSKLILLGIWQSTPPWTQRR